ncbi:helix-turn-helix transcriptional regulator [Oscillibacter hominis]|uniref:Helix-turn-helix transcriptional regulator n=1 Tax=Oscillibacter hominis TaxID=2763056 RepID=A0A7G9B538_9FIRM|nr:AraC family transcriptional regulator [Oscillibacter hominis]QNL44669.1 helix-turn-helix transcriptional regulator [Oscillibacter hominis]
MMQLPAFYLKMSRDDSWYMDRPHFHESVEFLLPVSSGDQLFVENEAYPLRPTVLFVLPDATLHKTLASKPYKRFVLHVPVQTLDFLSTSQTNLSERIHNTQYMVELGDRAEYFRDLLGQLEKRCEAHSMEFGADIEELFLLTKFLIEALSLAKPRKREPELPKHSMKSNSLQISAVLDYLQEHMTEKLTLDQIASEFYISKYHLSHCFKAATGFSVMEYLISSRILKARLLLQDGVRVQAAGEAVGFQSNEHFIRTFTSMTGISPKQYARQFSEGDRQ